MAAPKIAVITGPTATGKTALGIFLAKELGGEVVSGDSMQIYRRMDIGTAKVSENEMQGVAHHMINIADPSENYSVARFVSEADACVRDILNRGRLPIIVGGTGLYIDSLVLGRSFDDNAHDDALRVELEKKYITLGGVAMLQELAAIDPRRAEKLHPSDKKRILRGLEVWMLTGKTISAHDEESRLSPPRYDAMTIALSFQEREDLYSRIDKRVDLMVDAGLWAEVAALLESGVPENSTAMQAIGYKEVAACLQGKLCREDAIALIKQESRRYAKRQLTWLRRDKSVAWLLWNKVPDMTLAQQFSTDFFLARGLK